MIFLNNREITRSRTTGFIRLQLKNKLKGYTYVLNDYVILSYINSHFSITTSIIPVLKHESNLVF